MTHFNLTVDYALRDELIVWYTPSGLDTLPRVRNFTQYQTSVLSANDPTAETAVRLMMILLLLKWQRQTAEDSVIRSCQHFELQLSKR